MIRNSLRVVSKENHLKVEPKRGRTKKEMHCHFRKTKIIFSDNKQKQIFQILFHNL